MHSETMCRPRTRIDAAMESTGAVAQGILSLLSATRRKLDARLTARRRERAIAITMNQLSAFDDRMLREIGINRGDIYAASVALVDGPNVDLRELFAR